MRRRSGIVRSLVSPLATAALLLLGAAAGATGADAPLPDADTRILTPGKLVMVDRTLHFRDGTRVPAQAGVVLVPENRARTDSRTIAVHFWRIPARSPDRPPLFYLPGGPGDNIRDGADGDAAYSGYGAIEGEWTRRILDLTNGRSDVVFLSQRGNLGAQMSSSLGYDLPGLPLDRQTPAPEQMRLARDALVSAQDALAQSGTDLAGYNILNITDDLEDLRKALGYDRIMLAGGSFGSQWSFAYMRRYPANVDRAMLDGVEPLAFTYDSPAAVDRAVQRVLEAADRAPELAAHRPAGGFVAAFGRVMERLAKTPQMVTTEQGEVLIGAEDFARTIRDFNEPLSLRDINALFPAIVAEADKGDFRRVAEVTAAIRQPTRQTMIGSLIDSSLGISDALDRRLQDEARTSKVGDINLDYRAIVPVVATARVPDAFRAFQRTDIPILLLQGDMDMFTPMENAEEALRHLPNGTLIRVEGGTHNVANELLELAPHMRTKLQSFLSGERLAPGTETVVLPAMNFAVPARVGPGDQGQHESSPWQGK